MRREADFAVEQRIKASIAVSGKGAEAVTKYAEKIKADILATELCDDLTDCAKEERCEIGGYEVVIKIQLA